MRLLERRVTQVSLAVRLEDAFAPGRRIVGAAEVTLQRGGERWPRPPVMNPSGDFVFLDRPDGVVSVQISPGEDLTATRDVTLPMEKPLTPVLNVELTPTWHYPFPPAATLVQGLVQ